MNSIALLISYIFEPLVVIYVLGLLGGSYAGLTGSLWRIYIVSLTLFVGMAILVRLYFTRKDKTNWDVSDRKKRFVPLLCLSIFFGIQYFVIRSFGNASLSSLYLMLFVWNIGFFFITFKVKASGHLSSLTLAVCQTIAWFGFSYAPLILLLPLLSWSRLFLKRHTVSEVIAGISCSSILFLLSSIIG